MKTSTSLFQLFMLVPSVVHALVGAHYYGSSSSATRIRLAGRQRRRPTIRITDGTWSPKSRGASFHRSLRSTNIIVDDHDDETRATITPTTNDSASSQQIFLSSDSAVTSHHKPSNAIPRVEITTASATISGQTDNDNNTVTTISIFKDTVLPILQFTLYSLALALIWILGWEELACTQALPSRQYRNNYLQAAAILQQQQQQQQQDSRATVGGAKSLYYNSHHDAARNRLWGQATVRGMGFGQDERLVLLSASSVTTNSARDSDESIGMVTNLRSYNEVMLEHRNERVPRWREDYNQRQGQATKIMINKDDATQEYYATAIHTLCTCLANIPKLQQLAENYQWDTLRATLQTQPCWQQLEPAASRLRRTDAAVGFDWASCAWRGRCGALADLQESLDELDSLLGVLEPYEARFCLDIVERSLRDMLAEAPWELAGGRVTAEDRAFWKGVAEEYRPHRVFDPELEDEESERIDDEYVQALQSLKIE